MLYLRRLLYLCLSCRVTDGPVPAQLHRSLTLRAGGGAELLALPAGSPWATLRLKRWWKQLVGRGAAVLVGLLLLIEPKVLLL